MQREIQFTFRGRKNGGTKTEAVGFCGSGCQSAIESIIGAVGGTLQDIEKTEDWDRTRTDVAKELE